MLALALAALLAGQAAPEAGSPGAEEALQAGIEAYRRGDFDAAARDLDRAARALEKDPPKAARAHLYLGFTLVALGQEPQAEAELERALKLDPSVDASSASPKIRELFGRVARRVGRGVKDTGAPEVRGVTALPVSEGTPLDFIAQVTDPSGVAAVRLQYRVRGGSTYGVLPLAPAAPTQFAGQLQPAAAHPPGIEFFVEAWDRLGNGPARLGAPDRPLFVEVRPAPKVERPTPFYERWWFWTGVGAAVAAGTAVALTAAREKTVHVTLTDQ